MTTLGNAPGGKELIESLAKAIKDLALLYANTPDDRAQESLDGYVDRISPELIEAVGAGNAAKMLEAFRSAVLTEKHKIESAGTSRA
jgi:hypothetical protein